jgi:hypothetical protein
VPSYYGCCNSEGWSAEMTANGERRLTTYGNYVGNRYKNFPNIIWVPVRALTFNMAKMTGTTTVRWYDPTSGAFTTVAGSPFGNTGSQIFTPPGNNSTGSSDWVLVFEAP